MIVGVPACFPGSYISNLLFCSWPAHDCMTLGTTLTSLDLSLLIHRIRISILSLSPSCEINIKKNLENCKARCQNSCYYFWNYLCSLDSSGGSCIVRLAIVTLMLSPRSRAKCCRGCRDKQWYTRASLHELSRANCT